VPSKTRASTKLPTSPLTADSLRAFIQARFPKPVKSGKLKLDYGTEGVSDQLLTELKDFGIHSLEELAAIIPADFDSRGAVVWQEESTNIPGILRDVMMVTDLLRNLSQAWKQDHGTALSEDEFPMLKAYGIDLRPLHEAGVLANE
jgi:hypothetical protein